jgi:hypothetical protein
MQNACVAKNYAERRFVPQVMSRAAYKSAVEDARLIIDEVSKGDGDALDRLRTALVDGKALALMVQRYRWLGMRDEFERGEHTSRESQYVGHYRDPLCGISPQVQALRRACCSCARGR